MKRISKKALLSPLVAATALAAALGLAPAPASAASTSLYAISSTMCSGNLCIRIYLPSAASSFGTIVVQERAWKYTFYGHFELQVPGIKNPKNSPENTNKVGGSGHYFTVPNNDGTFTAHAWLRTGSDSWSDIGTRTFIGAYI